MTVLDVDTDIYIDSSSALVTAAGAWYDAVTHHWEALSQCGDMAGSYDEARSWATSYDDHADSIVRLATDVAEAAHTYGAILHELGCNHLRAEHGATLDAPGSGPDLPPAPAPAVYQCRVPLPSAGGPGNGLIDEGLGLVEEVGIIVPDGDTTKLSTATDTWAQLAADEAVTALPAELDRIAAQFAAVTAPEIDHIDEDLRALKTAVEDVIGGFSDMSTSAASHRDGLVELRDSIKQQLEDLAEALVEEIAITAAISIAASVVSFGAGAAAGLALGSARVAALVARWGPPIRTAIHAFHRARNIASGVKVRNVLGKKGEVDRIRSLAPRRKPATPTPPRRPPLSPDDIKALQRGQVSQRPDGTTLNELLYRGERLTPEEQHQVDALKQALARLPSHEGPVVRHIDLSPEELNRYQRQTSVVEDGFVSSTTNPGGVNPAFAQSQNTEFRIMSRTGKPVGEHSGIDDEILFPSGAEFFCEDKKSIGGKTVVFLREI